MINYSLYQTKKFMGNDRKKATSYINHLVAFEGFMLAPKLLLNFFAGPRI